MKTVHYKLADISGRVVQEASSLETSVLTIEIIEPAGIYMLVLSDGNETATIRIVKE